MGVYNKCGVFSGQGGTVECVCCVNRLVCMRVQCLYRPAVYLESSLRLQFSLASDVLWKGLCRCFHLCVCERVKLLGLSAHRPEEFLGFPFLLRLGLKPVCECVCIMFITTAGLCIRNKDVLLFLIHIGS